MEPFIADPDFVLYLGDVRQVLAGLPDGSVDCCVTSPPYWGLRDYGHDGQIGLEQTPEAFVAEMVAVFAQVRRVLSDTGTCWLNLGDSYNAYNGNRGDTGSTLEGRRQSAVGRPKVPAGSGLTAPGLKPKDLVGIPWRVAFALQQPHYTGTIKDERDRIWLAAMIDAEGCIYVHKRKIGQSNGQGYDRKSDSYGSGLEVSNTNRAIVERVLALVGKGSISTSTRGRNQPLYRWNLRSNECRDVLREVYPHLVAKQHQARLAIGCPSSGVDAEKAHASLIALHNGAPSTIDFAAPETMFEPGWYLRSDVVWSKSNPMPESVTDRPTKSHEYVFLLTKSPRYFFDAEAVREQAVGPDRGPGMTRGVNGPHAEQAGLGRRARRTALIPNQTKEGVGTQGIGSTTFGHFSQDGGRNVRSVWDIATQPYAEAHFATFPEELPRRCIAAGCPAGGTVLDPFMGSGTTALVARRLGRKSVGIELNPEYAALCARRLQQLSLLAKEPAA